MRTKVLVTHTDADVIRITEGVTSTEFGPPIDINFCRNHRGMAADDDGHQLGFPKFGVGGKPKPTQRGESMAGNTLRNGHDVGGRFT